MSPRARDRILANLEAIYREAYDRAKAANDHARMADLDAVYQREQLLLEVLLDIRDTLTSQPGATAVSANQSPSSDPISALETIHRITKLR